MIVRIVIGKVMKDMREMREEVGEPKGELGIMREEEAVFIEEAIEVGIIVGEPVAGHTITEETSGR